MTHTLLSELWFFASLFVWFMIRYAVRGKWMLLERGLSPNKESFTSVNFFHFPVHIFFSAHVEFHLVHFCFH
uniref:Uncharacterized protein n=1 Tax=Kalanchoe fedtschenkoi TaxID=63787 RepID=A0A7N1A905_KALFE